MGTTLETKRTFPCTAELKGRTITFRLMTPKDRRKVNTFTKTLSRDDVTFLQNDITKPEVIDEWMAMVKRGRAIVILAEDKGGKIVGYASLYRNELHWTRHQGEIRTFVSAPVRGIGLGKRLASEVFQIAQEQDLDIIVCNIPRGQPHVRQMLEKVGFTVEALLSDWLMDQEGNTHDLIVMAHNVRDF